MLLRLLESGTYTREIYIPHLCDGRGEFFFHKNQFWYKTLVLQNKTKNLIKNPPQSSPLLQVQPYSTLVYKTMQNQVCQLKNTRCRV